MAKAKVTNRVRIIVENYALYLKFRVLGLRALTAAQRRRLAASGLVRRTDLGAPTVTDAYLQSHLGLLRQPESRKQIRDYAVQHIHESAGKFIDKFVEKAVADLSTTAAKNLLQHRNEVIAETRRSLAEGFGKKTSRQMARELREKTGELFKDWDRVVTTELAQATNMGAFDAIVENNRGKDPDEIRVYKSGPHDGKTCKHCASFWFLDDGVTPRVYKLSELLANGSNYGRKTAEWRPTVGITHPNERHFLLELPSGWGFRGGGIVFIKPGHDELKVQRG
jgi:hypothetical protein